MEHEHDHDLPSLPSHGTTSEHNGQTLAAPVPALASVSTSTTVPVPDPTSSRGLSPPRRNSVPIDPQTTRPPSQIRPITTQLVHVEEPETFSARDHVALPMSNPEIGVTSARPPRPYSDNRPFSIRKDTLDSLTPRPRSGLDWIVPERKDHGRPRTIGERLQPTIQHAIREKDKSSRKARLTGYALNIAIGLQVILGALTTGLSVVTTGKQTSIMTAILGGLATIVASYLARARGSNEPELSISRAKDLAQFIRQCEAFQMDHGHDTGNEQDATLEGLRRRFEELLGNANGERKLSSV